MNEKEVIRALKSERCPPSVLKRVQATIRSEKSSSTGWRWGIPVGISVAMVVLLSLAIINTSDHSKVGEEIAAKNGTADSINETVPAIADVEDYAAEAEKLKFALTYIGLTLREETKRNRDIILSRTVPVVKDSIESTEKYLYNKVRKGSL